jgi:hypothetical protein
MMFCWYQMLDKYLHRGSSNVFQMRCLLHLVYVFRYYTKNCIGSASFCSLWTIRVFFEYWSSTWRWPGHRAAQFSRSTASVTYNFLFNFLLIWVYQKFSTTLMTNYAVWPALQFVNFKYVPLHLKPSFVTAWGFLWSIYLSSVNFRQKL